MNEHAETLIDFIKILYIQFIMLSCKYIKFIKIKIIFFSKIFYNDQFRELLYILYYVRQYKSYQSPWIYYFEFILFESKMAITIRQYQSEILGWILLGQRDRVKRSWRGEFISRDVNKMYRVQWRDARKTTVEAEFEVSRYICELIFQGRRFSEFSWG